MEKTKLVLEKFKILSMTSLHSIKGGSDTDPGGPVVTVSTEGCRTGAEDDGDGI